MRIGIDIGGTFTDFVVDDGGDLRTFKMLSTPDDPARAVLEGIARLGCLDPPQVVHGSTVATNALLERKGARTAFVTTNGFGDLLTIARQTRTHIYDLFADRPEPLIPREACFEVSERVDHLGDVRTPLDDAQIPRLVENLRSQGIESVAVCLLFSFLRPEHEVRVSDALRDAGFLVSRSSEILPEHREYERASTTVVNAYVAPVLDLYLGRLEREDFGGELRIMQSNGGSIRADEARRHGVRTILSGPAGGVVGAVRVAKVAGFDNAITFDMGGTSTDVSLTRGSPQVTSEAEIDGLPIRVPVIDIHTIGAGGGSIAHVDAGGAVRVGPESAGSDPGPACYGLGGGVATVTDANVVLGRLPADHFLGGEMGLDARAAESAMLELAERAGLTSRSGLSQAHVAALGVVQIANAHMERAVRVISVGRGHDPADFVFVSFGGAGGLHACDVARTLGMRHVLIPRGASTLSAFGMLVADVVRDYVQTVMLPGDAPLSEVSQRFEGLIEQGLAEVGSEGVESAAISVHRELDIRYGGQSFELTVPFSDAFVAAFHEAHRERYGHADRNARLEIVNVRVRVVGETPTPTMARFASSDGSSLDALIDSRACAFEDGVRDIDLFDGGRLHPGDRVVGPAVIAQSDTTIYLSQGDDALVDSYGNLLIEVAHP